MRGGLPVSLAATTWLWGRRLLPMVVGAGLLYLGWRLATANAAPVDVDFFFGRLHDLPLWRALGTSFGLGAVLVGLFTAYQMARGGLVSRRYRKQLERLEAEVHQLRNLPLAPEPEERQPEDDAFAAIGGAVAEGSGHRA